VEDRNLKVFDTSFVMWWISFYLPLLSPVWAGNGLSPQNPIRFEGMYEWCDCGTGRKSVEIWPVSRRDVGIVVSTTKGSMEWIQFGEGMEVDEISWQCDGQSSIGSTRFGSAKKWWSIQQFTEEKPDVFCQKDSGRLKFATWDEAGQDFPSGFSPVNNVLSLPFVSGESDYYCIKIPVMLKLHTTGDVLAFAEARRVTCSDFASTDLIFKRSTDGGKTWGALKIARSLYDPFDQATHHTVVGNAVPVQLSNRNPFFPNRILLPHNVNNSNQWVQHSDDNGYTWSDARSVPEAQLPEWQWVASGPPGSIELSEQHPTNPFRVLFGGYHAKGRGNLANNVAHGHSVYSDDGGETWRLGAVGYGSSKNNTVHGDDKEGDLHFNEHQFVELKDGTVLANSRSLAIPMVATMYRLWGKSKDGGLTFPETGIISEMHNSLDGNEGSMVRDGKRDIIYYSGTHDFLYRTGLSIYRSNDSGKSWSRILEVDHFMSGYSSLQIDTKTDQLLLLYEQTDQRQLVMDPDRFIFRTFDLTDLADRPSIGLSVLSQSSDNDLDVPQIEQEIWI